MRLFSSGMKDPHTVIKILSLLLDHLRVVFVQFLFVISFKLLHKMAGLVQTSI